MPSAIACAASGALSDPLKESGAMRIFMLVARAEPAGL
jgi:hypothetical protein